MVGWAEFIAYAGLRSATGRLAFRDRLGEIRYAVSSHLVDVPVRAGLYFEHMTATPLPPRPSGVALWRSRLARPKWRMWFVYFPLCFVSSVLAISTWDVRKHGQAMPTASDLAMGVWLIGILAAVSLNWRRRFPLQIALATAVVPFVVPLDPVPALIAFGSLLVRRVDRVSVALGALVTASTFVSTWRDSRGTSSASSFWQMFRSGEIGSVHDPLSLPAVIVLTILLVAMTVGVAMLLRYRDRFAKAQIVVEKQQAQVDHLSDEVSRQADRERIAQEVHDALGHRLSLLSLHAGALEVTAGENQKVAESAALVRANAQQSMADLRSLLAMLRQPDSPDVAAAVPTLRDVPALIDETVATGVNLVSTAQLEGIGRLDETTSRSAFRITQELLTNARRHAPGIGVRVLVRAAPESGVEIEVANHLPVEAALEFRPGSGLDGIRHRVLTLGGDFRCFVDDRRVFRVAARLPWVWAAEIGSTWTPGEGEPR
ncbi:putative two-component sensor kinase [Janibacter sp. HTCC2649]|nr:putative two-component sensor kinase [Janibacter sp. HTCC2649]